MKQELELKTALLHKQCSRDFDLFIHEIFSFSFENFVSGFHIHDTAKYYQDRLKTCRISARDHFKSTALYAHFAWQVWKLKYTKRNVECWYMSYNENLSAYHIKKIKDFIKQNDKFAGLLDLKPTAEGIISFSWDGNAKITLNPTGLLKFKRGLHCDILYLDDPLRDPENKLEPNVIRKINRIFSQQVLDIPHRKHGQLHIVGTPQTDEDFFFDQELMKDFDVRVQPCIIEERLLDGVWQGKTLWEEWLSYDKARQIRDQRGEKDFNQEYQCRPAYEVDAYYAREELLERVDLRIPNRLRYEKFETLDEVRAGLDIGKKRHPSHLSVFVLIKDFWRQIASIWFDHMDYIDQVQLCGVAIDNFGIDKLYYDATRGELEALDEQGKLPPEMIPVNFSTKVKRSLATEMDRRIRNKKISFVEDDRQINQMLQVTSDLKAYETADGHGDSFWSNCLAFGDILEAEPRVRAL